MRYPMPNCSCEFEIPGRWLTEAGMNGFVRTTPAYRSTATAVAAPLREIEPPYRTPWTCPKDGHAFERTRLARVLSAIATAAEMEPVPLLRLPAADFPLAYVEKKKNRGRVT
jgi:hypothetical protein